MNNLMELTVLCAFICVEGMNLSSDLYLCPSNVVVVSKPRQKGTHNTARGISL
jgi:hypothetical protein